MKKLVVLGGGESGVGSAILGAKQGFDVFLSDLGIIKEKYRKVLIDNFIDFEEGKHTEENIVSADIVIKSPGIPKKAPLIKKLQEKGVELISEIEFASRYTDAKIIAITGSNGKTTTSTLVYYILKNAGLNVALAGNIGKSFAMQVATESYDYYVLEISSFQLDDCTSFKPNIAIILNFSPDHLDEYNYDYDLYVRAKFKITQHMNKDDFFIMNKDDEKTQQIMQELDIDATVLSFSTKHKNADAYLEDGKIKFKNDSPFEMNTEELGIQGEHNIANAQASVIASKLLKIKNEQIKSSLSTFEGVEHRLEKIAKINGVQYINDSKATNVNSVYYALTSVKKPVVLILGGVDKGNDYAELDELIEEKVKAIVCLGLDNTNIIKAFHDKVDVIVETTSMEEAVHACYSISGSGDTVLLSPACASFDLFKNFEDRGNQFKDEVQKL
ncbi:MAG: UDP-N-acetylmuramoyl-L-alanine--D-glutamate ligase [Flavobacteriales bacterium]|nr:UDP-N-acetylmuramoyl-L-alanine--D-glutamate ligase [Flavobacteriales bacterium]